jgi:hypothetical protein
MTASNPCGDCDLCCRLLAIEELEKPAGPTCVHHHGACTIYEDRPGSCRGFQCAWLKSQRLTPGARQGPDWRPDRANLMVYSERGGLRLNVVVDPAHPAAWKRWPYYSHFKRISERAAEGLELVVYVEAQRIVIFPHADVDLGCVQPGDRLHFGFEETADRRVPTVSLMRAPADGVPIRAHVAKAVQAPPGFQASPHCGAGH